ncbi:MAG: hypothetical protein D6790_13385, partial [Caldilineae bacterium]
MPNRSVLIEATPQAHAAMRASTPALMVIFGASGDLTRRKLLPALYSLVQRKLLPETFVILGYARSPYTDDSFRELAKEGVIQHGDMPFDEEAWQAFAQRLFYQAGGYDDPESFHKL